MFGVLTAAAFTRPADTTAYASGDLIANSTTAGSVAPIDLGATQGLWVRRARLRKTTATVANATIRVHLFSAAPTVTNGDNGAILANAASGWLGALDVNCDLALTTGAVGAGKPNAGDEIVVPGGPLYALLEARAAYAPGNGEQFTLSLETDF